MILVSSGFIVEMEKKIAFGNFMFKKDLKYMQISDTVFFRSEKLRKMVLIKEPGLKQLQASLFSADGIFQPIFNLSSQNSGQKSIVDGIV